MTERPEGTPEASPDEPEAPPTAETETDAPEAAAAATEERETKTGALDPESDAAQVDEIEAELEAEEAAEDEIEAELEAEQEADELEAEEEALEFEAEEEAIEAEEPFEPEPGSAAATAVGVAATGSAVARHRGAAPTVQRAPTQSELAVHVSDNASRFFVIGTVVIFVAILAFGLLAGNSGFFTATPAPPTAAPSVSAEPSASASASESADPSESAEASASPS